MMTLRERLIIVGTCGFAREIAWTASDVPASARTWWLAGFLGMRPDAEHSGAPAAGAGAPLLGVLADHRPAEDERFVVAIPAPRERLAVAVMLRSRGARFVSVIHPTALVHPSAVIGEGLVLRHYAGIGPNATIGDFVSVGSSAGPAHDTVVGDGCVLGNHSDVMGNARLGRGVTLGTHGVVLPWAQVGDFATVGVGSVVLRRVPAGATVFGVPARRLDFVPPAPIDDERMT